jgi:hypothetical protein
MTNKTTVFLDPRGPQQIKAEQEELLAAAAAEEERKQIEEHNRVVQIEKGAKIVTTVFSYLAILPLLFMVAFNYSLTKMFSLDKIGYVESLGIVVLARVLRGKKSNE